MTSDSSTGNPKNTLWSRGLLPAGIILTILFFSAILRDIHFPEGMIGASRDAVLETFGSSHQMVWFAFLAAGAAFYLYLNLRDLKPQSVRFSMIWDTEPRGAIWIATLVLACFAVVLGISYAMDYRHAGAGTDALVLCTGLLINQGLIRWFTDQSDGLANSRRSLWLDAFIITGCLSLLLTPFSPQPTYFYHGQARWIGIYATPNEFGMMVAAIFVVAVGRMWKQIRAGKRALAAAYLPAVGICGLGVLKSYSRAAWIAVLAGFAFLLWSYLQHRSTKTPDTEQSPEGDGKWLRKAVVWGAVGVGIGICAGIGFKALSQSKLTVVQRSLSAFKLVDFSSRNRLASYQDGIEMLADHPLAGFGWRPLSDIHESLYLQSGLSDGHAVRLNDFLTLAIRLGLPTFGLFALAIWVWLRARPKSGERRWNVDIALCQAGVLMFAVSFCFSDGLCRLAPGGSFWLLLILTMDFDAVSPPQKRVNPAAEAVLPIPNK